MPSVQNTWAMIQNTRAMAPLNVPTQKQKSKENKKKTGVA